MSFKEMEVKFHIKRNANRFQCEFDTEVKIKRRMSKTLKQGDYSFHTITVGDKVYKNFDTHLKKLSTDRSAWISFWLDWLQHEWKNINVKILDYQEQMVDEKV